MSRYYAAVNQSALNGVETLEIYGNHSFYYNDSTYARNKPDIKGTFKEIIIKGEKQYSEVNLKEYGPRALVYNGETSWGKTRTGLTDFKYGSGDSIRINLLLDIEGHLYNWEKKGHILEYLGERTIDNKSYWCIEVTDNHGYKLFYYLDKKNYLIRRINYLQEESPENPNTRILFPKYKKWEDIYFPKTILMYSILGKRRSWIVNEVKEVFINRDIDPAIFYKKGQ